MALLTPLPAGPAGELALDYGLSVQSIEPLRAGSVNSNFRLTDSTGTPYFVRIYEEQAQAGAEREVELLRVLCAAGVPSARPLARRDGAWISEYSGKPVAFFEWVDGEIVCQKRVTVEHCERIGRALAQVHGLRVASFGEGRFGVENLHARLDSIEACAEPELVASARLIREKLVHYAALRNPELARGLIHGDLFKDNVLWSGSRVRALLDFESASDGPFVYDLMVTLHAWCYADRFDSELVQGMLRGYRSVRELEPNEALALPVEGALAALRFATTRITDFSMRAAPGMPPARDFRRFLARLAAVEQGAIRV